MLWIKAFHIIFIVTWFSGLFYLPRLFVYHSLSTDEISNARFKIMERKLYFGIITPSSILTIAFGIGLLSDQWMTYQHLVWMYLKLTLVFLLLWYQLYLGKLLFDFRADRNKHSSIFYRYLNEVPTVFLIAIVLLAILQPNITI